MIRDICMRMPSVRKALWGALRLVLTGYAPSPSERGANSRGLSQRDVERDYMKCEYKAQLANEQHFYSQRSPSLSAEAPKAPPTTPTPYMEYRTSMR
jgi:hypothetical protein